MMKTLLLAGSALALALPFAAHAQDHAGHEGHGAPTASIPPASIPQASPAPAPQVDPAPEGEMDHTQMDHAHMNHSAMGHMAMPMDQMPMEHASGGPAEGSGTARLPQAAAAEPGLHFDLGSGWMGMVHGYASSNYTDHGGPRGDDKLYVQSMAMLMAEKRTDTTRLQLRAMLSAEPLMSDRGYPNLFATGETYGGGIPIVDRQHPHDLFMELAGRFDVKVGGDTTAFLYGGPVAEPALGPSAFMHRASARLNPEPPISHHWFDSTHITYGVVTAGLASPVWQVEASAFRGAEPDENRWDIETPKLDSWSVRATLNPTPNWAMQVSHGRIKQPEAGHPGEDEARTTASVHYDSGKGLSAMAAYSAKNRLPGSTLTAWLAEANWDITQRHTLFGRYENVANAELFPDHADPLHDQTFRVAKLQAGYAYNLPLADVATLSLGGAGAKYFKPAALDGAYGRNPLGYTLFARLTLGR
ncbi:MAG: hypothetical protein RLZZ08_1794 [Pseudomonadota bacterium]|jgi:hypothetical protein